MNKRGAKACKKYLIVSNDGCARGLMAMRIMKKRIQEAGLAKKVELGLSGLLVAAGQAPDPLALAVLQNKGCPASASKPQQVNDEILSESDAVIALSIEDFNYLKNTYKALPQEVTVLDIPAVVERREAAFDVAYGKIERAIDWTVSGLGDKRSLIIR